MQQAIFQQASITQIQTQATRVVSGHGTGVDDPAINDDNYHDVTSPLRVVLSVMANVVGGTLLFSGMFILPYVIAGILS